MSSWFGCFVDLGGKRHWSEIKDVIAHRNLAMGAGTLGAAGCAVCIGMVTCEVGQAVVALVVVGALAAGVTSASGGVIWSSHAYPK
jgi:hypothetical protein